MDLKSFDWRSLQRYLNPQAADDFSRFLEKLPQTVGPPVLVAAGVAWVLAASIGLYTTVQIKNLTALRNTLKETEILQPVVPRLRDVAVDKTELKNFADTLSATYPDLVIRQQGPTIEIGAKSTANFAEFREAVGHVQNGGSSWRVSVDHLCVGRECAHDQLAALLKISKVSVDKPQ